MSNITYCVYFVGDTDEDELLREFDNEQEARDAFRALAMSARSTEIYNRGELYAHDYGTEEDEYIEEVEFYGFRKGGVR